MLADVRQSGAETNLEVTPMKKTREQRRVELKAKADEIIERLLDWTDAVERPNLTQIEDIVLGLREELSQSMVENVISAQESVQPAAQMRCPTCGGEMRAKGRRPRQLESRVGEMRLERGYYTCPQCGSGIFPP